MADTTRNSLGYTPSGSLARGTPPPIASGEHQAEHGASRAVEDAKQIGTELIAAVCDGATTLFEQQRDRAANEIAVLSEVLRRSVQSLDQMGQGGGTVARCGNEAAREIGELAKGLRRRSWNELTSDVEEFGRRWPLAFIATAIGLGVFGGRLLLSSTGRTDEPAAVQPASVGQVSAPGARHDYVAVGRAIPGGARSDYGTAGSARENG